MIFDIYFLKIFYLMYMYMHTHGYMFVWSNSPSNIDIFVRLDCIRGGKNTNSHGYPWIKSVTGTGRVAKRVSMGIINGYLTTHYYIDRDTDLLVPIPTGTHIR
jgi:hypothetical protein